jgi:hypothetical protein
MFHPTIQILLRRVGTVSGSSFTSLENFLSNFILLHIVLYEYCIKKFLDPYTFVFKVRILGDDCIIGTDIPLDYMLFFEIADKMFGASIKLEHPEVLPGIDEAFYLGYNRINGSPFREERILVASVVFGSGDFPKMSTDELLQSRFFEVFGNVEDFWKYFKRLRIEPRKRFFFFHELSTPFRSGRFANDRLKLMNAKLDVSPKIDRRGFWFKFKLTEAELPRPWVFR